MSRRPASDRYEKRRLEVLEAEERVLPEQPSGIFDIVLASPGSYASAMSSLRYQSAYHQLSAWPETNCERAFFPEKDEHHWRRRYGHPMVTLETGRSIRASDLLVFAFQSELDYERALEMMSVSGIRLPASERREKWPLLVAGGIPVTSNPMPMARFMDAFVIGETEPSIGPVLDTIKSLGAQGASKVKMLRRLAALPGMYVPSVHGIPGRVSSIMRQWAGADRLGVLSCARSPRCMHGGSVMLEISRGCPYSCKFCLPGYVGLPYRETRLEDVEMVMEELPRGTDIALMGCSPTSHSEMKAIEKAAKKGGHSITMVSLHPEDRRQLRELSLDLSRSSLVMAPETGSDDLRRIIGKRMTNADILSQVRRYVKTGGRGGVRLFFMVGLPFETDGDRATIVELVKDVRKLTSQTLRISVNPFVPKPWTAFQWCGMKHPTVLRKMLEDLEERLAEVKGKVELTSGDPRDAHVRALLARGESSTGKALEERLTGVGWNTAFDRAGIDMGWVFRDITPETPYEWDFLNMGFGHTRLSRELQASLSLDQSRHMDAEDTCEE